MEQFLQYSDQGLFLLRLAVAAVFLVHATMKFKKVSPMTAVGVVELIAAIALVVGLYTQVAALALGVVMLGATYMKIAKWKTGFVNGWEFDLILLAANVVILTSGGGSIGV
ncbi:MAG: DoxX family protein [Candidatus Sungbacteria bacterium]|uniref:DoxX family protein n=1 Tax=Candidatus Sungiibacteriota bacterium TaxID=2750080 RepID=A0A932YWW6_9BACT|nr:DoxX family protein [Parcubacteria group bacterium]MBI4132946.1 DoxX family protein [Candidatus Sungbacteria bacterium]